MTSENPTIRSAGRGSAATGPGRRIPQPSTPSRSQPPDPPSSQEVFYREHSYDIVEDLCQTIVELRDIVFSDAPTHQVMAYKPLILRLMDDLEIAAVGRGRSRMESPAELAAAIRLSPERLRKKYTPAGTEHRMRSRTRPTSRRHTGTRRHHIASCQNYRSLTAALAHLLHTSPHSQRTLAKQMCFTPSYISRLMSGERTLSWSFVSKMTEVCGRDPELLRPLWNAAFATSPPGGTDAVQYLRDHLRALRVAAGDPSDTELLKDGGPELTRQQLQLSFTGPGVPSWETVRLLARTLTCSDLDLQPLWRTASAAHAHALATSSSSSSSSSSDKAGTTGSTSALAEAFG